VLKSLVVLTLSISSNISLINMLPLDNLTMAPKFKQLNTANRKAACCMVRAMCDDNGPARGAFSVAASFFNISRQAISALYMKIESNIQELENNGTANDEDNVFIDSAFASDIGNRRKGKCKHDRVALKAAIKALSSNQRRKHRHLSAKVNVPVSTLHKLLKGQQFLKRHSSALKPKLASTNKRLRVLHALEQTDETTINSRTQPMKCRDLFDEVHVDEKWFHVSRDGESCVIVHDEEPPEREVGHKSHMTNAMFLCAQARPRKLSNNTWWDGNIGIWSVGFCRAAQRDSVNRPAGTLLFENETIDMDKCRSMVINDVVPAMLNEFPDTEHNKCQQIVIQQDGAPTHVNPRDHEWMQCLTDMGTEEKIKLATQPANSPDLNVNDLSFFNAPQSMHCCTAPTNEADLIEMAKKTFKEHPANKINRLWLSLQTVFNNLMEDCGGNKHKMTHMGKEKLERENRLPVVLEATPMAKHFLNDDLQQGNDDLTLQQG